MTVQYNLCNEPRIKYSMAAVADRGLKPSQWTSARLRGEVMVLETHRARYELSRNAPPPDAPAEALHVRPPQALAVAARWQRRGGGRYGHCRARSETHWWGQGR